MPKSAKKRKDKAADFSKAKLKLGKGKQLASNVIDTSFKARSIALPTQSIAQEKDPNAPTTKRKLTFDDLVLHTKHYNPITRKDAIQGLRELLEAHWEILDSSLTNLINACVRIIGDEDASVRRAVLTFFAWLLPQIPYEDILPHSQLLLLFTTSAQTHIFPEIRIDAIRFLNMFLEYIPNAVIAGWNAGSNGHGVRVLEGYLGILNAGTKFGEGDGQLQATSTASVVITPASKLVVLQSLSTFLRIALPSLTAEHPDQFQGPPEQERHWFMASCFPTVQAHRSFQDLLRLSDGRKTLCHTWIEDATPDNFTHVPSINPTLGSSTDPPWSLQELTELDTVSSSDVDIHDWLDAGLVARLARSLHPVLLATFLDCAPLVLSLSSGPSETEAQSILAVGQIVRSLYGFILQCPVTGTYESSAESLIEILSHMAPYFPFSSSGSRNIKLEQAFQDLNVIFCELVSLQMLTAGHHGVSQRTSRGKSRTTNSSILGSKNAWSTQTLRVGDYILQLLRGEGVSSLQLGRPLTRDAYIALLPSIWALLNSAREDLHEMSVAVLHSTIDLSIRASCKSALKIPTIEFIAQLILLEGDPLYQGHFRFRRDDEKIREWTENLPRALWEFGANNLQGSELIVKFLSRILQRKTKFAFNSETIKTLQSKLVPYFSVQHSVRGQLLGPFSKLPTMSVVRKLALDVVINLSWMGGGDDERLIAAVDLAVRGSEVEAYWMQLRKLSHPSSKTL